MAEKRLAICVKDIVLVTGKSERQSWRILTGLKDSLGKKRTAVITIKEYCSFFELDYGAVKKILNVICGDEPT
ncbi:MAG: hypothetical protein ACXVNR_07560 [Bacteroidia bacterium]